MPQSPVRETAQIIPFPKGGRTNAANIRESVHDQAARMGVTLCDYGSGWYHDAAMQEELAKSRKH
jgi:hypothetical protein